MEISYNYLKIVSKNKNDAEEIYEYIFKNKVEASLFNSFYVIELFHTNKIEVPRHLIKTGVEVYVVEESINHERIGILYTPNKIYYDNSSNNLEFSLYKKDMGKIELAYNYIKDEANDLVLESLDKIKGSKLYNSIINALVFQSPFVRYKNNEDIFSLNKYFYQGKNLDLKDFLSLFDY